ncbi:unnamed protein product [Calicophoron daubneyi]|uniref:2Fe-2S ferredoxin-type domain-containing protein n=1 Tax=Calicophoron daubneyi TaxID=300641 RepID=A0AAV2T0J9_CALDB
MLRAAAKRLSLLLVGPSFYRSNVSRKNILRASASGVRYNSTANVERVEITFAWKDGKTKTVNAKVGSSFLDVVLDNNVDIDGFGACEGKLACSTCHLIFPPNVYGTIKEPMTAEEQDMLDIAFDVCDTSRLGCQVTVAKTMDGMTVTVPEGIYDVRD